jgi:hypothetical protein
MLAISSPRWSRLTDSQTGEVRFKWVADIDEHAVIQVADGCQRVGGRRIGRGQHDQLGTGNCCDNRYSH